MTSEPASTTGQVRPGAPARRPDPGEQLVDAERLGDVVVGAEVERLHLVVRPVPGRQHDDRQPAPRAQPAQHLDARRGPAARGRARAGRAGPRVAACSAVRPSAASSTSWPSARRPIASVAQSVASSSTTSTLTPGPPRRGRAPSSSPPPGVSSTCEAAALRLGQPTGHGQARARRRRRAGVAQPLERLEHPGPVRQGTPGPWSATRTRRAARPRSRDLTRRRCAAARWRAGSPAPARAARGRRPRSAASPTCTRSAPRGPQRAVAPPRRAAPRTSAGRTAPVCSRLMSSRSLTMRGQPGGRLHDGVEQGARSSASSRSPCARRVSAAERMPASGVRRSWETAASSAVRVRLPASSSRAASVWRASSSRSRSTPRWEANAPSDAALAGVQPPPAQHQPASRRRRGPPVAGAERRPVVDQLGRACRRRCRGRGRAAAARRTPRRGRCG